MSKLQKTEQVLLFLTVFFLPTQLGKHFWPYFSFVYSLPIDYLSPVIYFWDLLVIILCTVFIFEKKKINKLALNLFFFFLLTQALSLITDQSVLGVGLVRLEQYVIAGFFGVYLASADLSKLRRIIFWALTGSLVGEAILAITQFSKGASIGFWIFGERTFYLTTPGIAKFDFNGIQLLRPYATFPHPNVLAGFLIIITLILSDIRISGQKLTKKIIFILSGVVVLLTVSRTALLAGFISALFIVKNKGKFWLGLVFVCLLPILYVRYSSIFNFDNLALVRREELSISALTLFFKSPILGIGLNNFIPFASELLLAGPSRFLQPVHNIFLLALSETGLVGFFGWLMLFGYPMIKKSNLQVWFIVIFLGMFDHYFLTLPQGYRLIFFIWGLALSMLKYPSGYSK